VLTELKNRGVADVCMVVCDGLKGLPEAIEATWPHAVVQTRVIHLLRASFRYAGRQHWDAMAKALRPVYTAPTEAAAQRRFAEFVGAWGARYPALIRFWDYAWAEFVPSSRSAPRSARSDRVGQRPHPPRRKRASDSLTSNYVRIHGGVVAPGHC
jgi:transposase-like protein